MNHRIMRPGTVSTLAVVGALLTVFVAVPAFAQPVEVVDDFHVPSPEPVDDVVDDDAERDTIVGEDDDVAGGAEPVGDEVEPAEVLGVSLDRGGLPLTGTDVLLLVVFGVGLLFLGYLALRGGRRASAGR